MPELWSISRLAAELGRDRRTISALLRNVPPDGTLAGHPAWLLATALRSLRTNREETMDLEPDPAGTVARLALLDLLFHAGEVAGPTAQAALAKHARAFLASIGTADFDFLGAVAALRRAA